MLFRGFQSIFGRKLKKLIFRPKMDPGGQKLILVQKSKVQIIRSKLA